MSSTYAFTSCPIKPITVTLLTVRLASLVPLSLVHLISPSLMLSRCRMYPDDLFIARSLQPSLVRGRNWRPSAANLVLGSYPSWIFQLSLNAIQTTYWWRVHQQDPLTLPSAGRQQQAKVGYSLLVDLNLYWSRTLQPQTIRKGGIHGCKIGWLIVRWSRGDSKGKKSPQVSDFFLWIWVLLIVDFSQRKRKGSNFQQVGSSQRRQGISYLKRIQWGWFERSRARVFD